MALSTHQSDIVILRGVLLQNFDSIGINQLDGRGAAPAPVYASEQRVQSSGAWVTKAYDTPQSFTLGGWVSGYTIDRRDHFLNIVRNAASTSDSLLTFPFNGGYVTYTVRRTSEFNVTFLNENTAFWSFTATAFNPRARAGGQKITYYGESSGFHKYVPRHRKSTAYVNNAGKKVYKPQKRRAHPNYDDGKNGYKPIRLKGDPDYISGQHYTPIDESDSGYDDGNNDYIPIDGVDAPVYDDGDDSYVPIDEPDSGYDSDDPGDDSYLEGALLYDLQFEDGFFEGIDADSDSFIITGVSKMKSGPPADGFKMPASFTPNGISFGASSVQGGSIALKNVYDSASLRFRIDGACVNPSITVTTADNETHILSWDYLTMGATESLEIDVDEKTSILDGTSSRPPSQRDWPVAGNGTNVFVFTADSYSADTVFTVYMEPIAQ